MTTLEELKNTVCSLSEGKTELIEKIRNQSIFTVSQLLEDEPKLNKNNVTEYNMLFCIGAVWAISQNINHQKK